MSEFWVSNISLVNVSLSDLALTIKARSSVNLLDSRHYSYTLEQLQKSAESGSLYKKSDKIKLRKYSPTVILPKKNIEVSNKPLFSTKLPLRSQVVVEDIKYDELNFESDERFAEDMSDEDD